MFCSYLNDKDNVLNTKHFKQITKGNVTEFHRVVSRRPGERDSSLANCVMNIDTAKRRKRNLEEVGDNALKRKSTRGQR